MSRSLSLLTLSKIACPSVAGRTEGEKRVQGVPLTPGEHIQPLNDNMEDQNAPSLGDHTSQPSTSSTLTAIPPGLDKKELRQKMIEILASTANGCLEELGYYPGIHDKVQQLEKRASDWQSENVKLFSDNHRLYAMVNQQKQAIERLQAEDQRKTTTIQQLKVGNGALNKSLEEVEATLLKRDPKGPAEYFNRKYNGLLKEYQALSGEHGQAVRQLSQFKRIQSNAVPITQQAQPIAQNIQQQPHQVQSSQQQQQMLHQIPIQHPSHPTAPSQPLHPSASIFTSLNTRSVHHPPQQQNVAYQQQMQQIHQPGTSSDRRLSGSMPGPSKQLSPQTQMFLMQQQQLLLAQARQNHPHLVPPNQPPNAYPNGPTQPPQRANTYPIVPGQSVQHPQPHAPQPQMAPFWTSSPQPNQPAGNQPQAPQGLWINTSNASAQNTSSPRPISSPQTLVQTSNSAPFSSISPLSSQFGRLSATPNAPSRPSSLSQASSPIVPPVPTPQNHPLNAHAPSQSPSLKRHSLSISNTPSQSGDDVIHKRPRIDGPPTVPKDISGLPSPITPSVQHVHAMSGPAALVRPMAAPVTPLQSSPAPLTMHRAPARPVEITQPVNGPVTPAQSQSPQPPQAAVGKLSQKEATELEPEAMEVDVDQPTKQGSTDASIKEDAVHQGDEDDEDGETVEVGPDGLRLVSDCLDELFGKNRSGTFICKFCVVRHKMNLRSEPAMTYESPSDEDLAQHLTSDHATVWDRARAVDD